MCCTDVVPNEDNDMMHWMFWVSLAVLVYVYIGFPVLVIIVGQWRRQGVWQQPITPSMSLIIVAYNEAHVIASRLDNALALNYPSDALEILVASDGSDDATEAIVATYASRGVQLLRLPRRGKNHALNAAVAQARGDILVFSDANTLCDRQALRHLARNFADPRVGGVAGRKTYLMQAGSEASSHGESAYWTYDTWLKQMESLAGSIVSADGAIYAVRRHLYRALADTAVTDDFAVSTAVVAQGYRLVFEADACAYEEAMPTAMGEFQRKVRLMTRGLRGVIRRKHLLNPCRYGFYAVVLGSHKLLRRVVPVFLLCLLVTSLLLSLKEEGYLGVVLAQLSFYGLAALGFVWRQLPIGRQPYVYMPFFYCLANAAALMALIKLLRGERIESWQPQRHQSGT